MSRVQYRKNMQSALAEVNNLDLKQGSVQNVLWEDEEGGKRIKGVVLGESD